MANFEKVKEQILAEAENYLVPAPVKGWICPVCGSGSGAKGTGMTTKDGKHYTCWAQCGVWNMDIIDIIGLEKGLTSYEDKLKAAAKEVGVPWDDDESWRTEAVHRRTAEQDFADMAYQNQNKIERNTEDLTEFFLQAHARIGETDYHRGLSRSTLDRFCIGYDPAWKPANNPKAWASPRLIIPTGKGSYLARDTRSNLTESQKAYDKQKHGAVHVFNAAALKSATVPVFVVEGEIDAMSIVDVGGEAVGLGSISNTRLLIDLVKDYGTRAPLVIALDNDERGREAQNKLTAALQGIGVRVYTADICGEYKDPNERLMNDREGLTLAVEAAAQQAREQTDSDTLTELELIQRESAMHDLPDFLRGIEDSKRATAIPTGFPSLDKVLDGGLYAGLYVIGAISSLGKTTFCLQVADQIAEQGNDVLIFSLEMAKAELIAKSVSRLTLLEDLLIYGDTKYAKTTRGILTGSRYKDYSEAERQTIKCAVEAYGRYAGNIYITEGVGDIGVDAVREKVKRHVTVTGRHPVVLIDYLQILAPADPRYTDKQNTDRAVLELKRLSRDYGIPVIGISSFNRDNYTAPVNLTSFKESGAIEYSSDVLLGLQYEGMDYSEGETEKARDTRVRGLIKDELDAGRRGFARHIQVKVLKNRNGSQGDTVLDFFPMYNYFKEPENSGGRRNVYTDIGHR